MSGVPVLKGRLAVGCNAVLAAGEGPFRSACGFLFLWEEEGKSGPFGGFLRCFSRLLYRSADFHTLTSFVMK